MLKTILEKLNQAKVAAWQVREARKSSLQSYVALNDRECVRRVDTVKYRISLHVKKPGAPDKIGLAGFTIGEGQDALLDKQLSDALQAAALTQNEAFALPDPYPGYPQVVLSDVAWDNHHLTLCENRLKAALAKETGVRLSTAEFFLDRIESKLINSNGLQAEQTESQVYCETILLASDGAGGEKEFINRLTRRTLADLDLDREMTASARQAREATKAKLPKTGSFPVVFTDEPLDRLFDPMVARASGRLKYARMLDVEKGKLVTEKEPAGDPLTLWSDPLLPEMTGSTRFDGYGTPAQKVCLIENNRVKTLLADHRYASYLKTPVTGELGNVTVNPGTRSEASLLDPNERDVPVLYQITAFSAFEPNAITGAFSAEIRSGYEITPQGRTPIKGGSVSGVLQRDLVGAFFSKETERRERAVVPRAVYFPKLSIAGT